MRILVVEDEPQIRTYLKQELEQAGFAVDAEPNGRKGSYLARTNEYDVAVLDMRLPEMNGIEICQEIRKKRKTFPILMLTVVSDTDTKVQAFDAGADDYLTKPFERDELLARVRALLRRPQQIIGDRVRVGEILLDVPARAAYFGDVPLELTRKEFQLLEYFMRNAGTLLTRTMILEHVWDMHMDPFTNTVDVHVRSLRRKLRQFTKREVIGTLRGEGYIFRKPRKQRKKKQ
jgi:DNA-binding response OmpR family regulator